MRRQDEMKAPFRKRLAGKLPTLDPTTTTLRVVDEDSSEKNERRGGEGRGRERKLLSASSEFRIPLRTCNAQRKEESAALLYSLPQTLSLNVGFGFETRTRTGEDNRVRTEEGRTMHLYLRSESMK